MSCMQAIKLMRNRGVDNEVVGFGHFGEARMVKESPTHVVVDPAGKCGALRCQTVLRPSYHD